MLDKYAEKCYTLLTICEVCSMNVTYNFSAGPAAFVPGVVADICDALTGGRAETEYGSDAYRDLYTGTADELRALVGIPQNYRIIFMPGGSSIQYSAPSRRQSAQTSARARTMSISASISRYTEPSFAMSPTSEICRSSRI